MKWGKMNEIEALDRELDRLHGALDELRMEPDYGGDSRRLVLLEIIKLNEILITITKKNNGLEY